MKIYLFNYISRPEVWPHFCFLLIDNFFRLEKWIQWIILTIVSQLPGGGGQVFWSSSASPVRCSHWGTRRGQGWCRWRTSPPGGRPRTKPWSSRQWGNQTFQSEYRTHWREASWKVFACKLNFSVEKHQFTWSEKWESRTEECSWFFSVSDKWLSFENVSWEEICKFLCKWCWSEWEEECIEWDKRKRWTWNDKIQSIRSLFIHFFFLPNSVFLCEVCVPISPVLNIDISSEKLIR